MIGSDFMDEIDCGSFFDQIEDLIEFPADNLGSGNCKEFPSIWSNTPAGFPGSGPIFSGHHSSNVSELSAELAVPVEDIVQLEWLSNFMEDSFSGGGLTLGKENSPVTKDSSHNQFQTSSPVSVLESSTSSSSSSSSNNSTCSLGKTLPLVPTQRGLHRARSKRPRPATFNPRPAMQLISPSSSTTENSQLFSVPVASYDNFADSPRPMKKIPKAASVEHKKKKKLKLSLPLGPVETNQNPPSQGVRKCLHCEITKTPQWRAGPMGPKTLCNACGVRYKSGRLFPEYRPAASPTFIPSLHSNSHKKVVEMRTKGIGEKSSVAITVTTSPTFAEPELIPNVNPSLEGVGA